MYCGAVMPSAVPESFKRLLDSHTLAITAVAVLMVKLATFAADPTSLFFMGNSAISTSLGLQASTITLHSSPGMYFY